MIDWIELREQERRRRWRRELLDRLDLEPEALEREEATRKEQEQTSSAGERREDRQGRN
ncbi:MAG: hypothetical protein IN808_07515 [Rubrobacter sp.]|jgi:hypothetical protein|nr:hypothetical protein [Rubrobacter sp.]